MLQIWLDTENSLRIFLHRTVSLTLPCSISLWTNQTTDPCFFIFFSLFNDSNILIISLMLCPLLCGLSSRTSPSPDSAALTRIWPALFPFSDVRARDLLCYLYLTIFLEVFFRYALQWTFEWYFYLSPGRGFHSRTSQRKSTDKNKKNSANVSKII